ncbi:MAG: YqgE/AlgH family protein [Deltaproteobacteria bacterium]|nr:YqgE/AlgH family protein [Deltaproteobacteria bacterium]
MEHLKPTTPEHGAASEDEHPKMLEEGFVPRILLAMPSLKDGYFDKSVILLCEYNKSGALGFVINSPSTTSVDDLLLELGLSNTSAQNQPIMIGGPVQPELCWVVHSEDYHGKSSTPLGYNLSLSAAQEVLTSITEGHQPDQYMLGVGYAGWGPGQLDREIEEEAWWMVEADPRPLFQVSFEKRWDTAMSQFGLKNCMHTTCKA